MAPAFFHGPDSERNDLLLCLARNCACTYAPSGARMTCCPGHAALVEDQKLIDRWVFMRRQRALLMGQEFSVNRRRFL